ASEDSETARGLWDGREAHARELAREGKLERTQEALDILYARLRREAQAAAAAFGVAAEEHRKAAQSQAYLENFEDALTTYGLTGKLETTPLTPPAPARVSLGKGYDGPIPTQVYPHPVQITRKTPG